MKPSKLDFYELLPERILAAVERLNVRATGFCMALNSYENRVYEVGIEADARWPGAKSLIVKFYRPNRWSHECIQEEHDFLSDLKQAEIPVVAPLVFDDGQTLQQDGGLLFCVFPKAMGRSISELGKDEIAWMGRLVGRMHSVGALKKSKHRPLLNPQTYGEQSLDDLLNSSLVPEELQPLIADLEFTLLQPLEDRWYDCAPKQQRIHGDLHVSNLLWGEAGPFFLDFDDSCLGPKIQDLWLLLPGPLEECEDFFKLFVRNYEVFSPFPHEEVPLIEDLRKLRILRYSAWIAKRWDDPAFPLAFPDFGTREYFVRLLRDLQ